VEESCALGTCSPNRAATLIQTRQLSVAEVAEVAAEGEYSQGAAGRGAAAAGGGSGGKSGSDWSWDWSPRRRSPPPPPPPPLQARVWAATRGDVTAYPWPEQSPSFGLFQRTKNVGVAISGGSHGTYAAGFGQLRALRDLRLLPQLRYLVGSSAGGLLAAAYTYHQLGVDDDELVGSTPAPGDLTMERLADLPRSSLAFGATGDMLFQLGGQLVAYIARGRTRSGDIWASALGDAFLDHFGLGSDKYFTFSAAARDEILARNRNSPHLAGRPEKFLLPASPIRPFLILPVSTVGPLPRKCLEMPPSRADAQKCASYRAKLFRPMAATPLYTGYAADRGENLTVELGDGTRSQVHEGGLVESWAWGGAAPSDGRGAVQAGVEGQLREIGNPAHPWSLKAALSACTQWGAKDIYWYENGARTGPGSSVTTDQGVANQLTQPIEGLFGHNLYDGAQMLGQEYRTWDTSDAHPETEEIFATDSVEAGGYTGMDDLLARGVDHIISFMNHDQPLCGEDAWDPAADQSPAAIMPCFSAALAAMFGIEARESTYGQPDVSAAHNQVFPRSSFAPFVKALQASMKAQKTAFARMTLTTVANDWRKIPAGRQVDVAMFYLTPSEVFEAALPAATLREIREGHSFTGFPNYRKEGQNPLVSLDMSKLWQWPPGNPVRSGLTRLTEQQVNLLAGLSGWAVLENGAAIRDMFS